jgi:hypothetical protein
MTYISIPARDRSKVLDDRVQATTVYRAVLRVGC